MADLLAGPYLAAALLLAAAGVAKLRHPGTAAEAIAAAGLPGTRWVRLLGGIEMAVGGSCLVGVGPVAPAALAILYAAFAAFLVRLRAASGGSAPCGCVGRERVPTSLLHVGLDILAAGAGAAAAVWPTPGLVAFASRLPMAGIPQLLGVGLIAYLSYLAAVYLPGSFLAYRGRIR